ncbi:MAG: hypothetical protein F2817_10935 [Actinobacteria bacterium]|nr:hypothetical protein [Actinomycetota bacterium]
MAKRQTRPLTPAEAVRQGRKLIAERQRQARTAAQPEPAGQGGVEPVIGMPISEQDQRVEVVAEVRADGPTLIFAATIVRPEINTHPDGAWPISDLRTRQCRFACTDDRAPADQHRFCGRRTHVGPGNLHGSWCDEHLPHVWGQGTVSERNAHHVAKDVRRFG